MSTTTTVTETHSENAQQILRLFPEINTDLATQSRSATQDQDLAGYDEEQIRLMDEVCIVLDTDDAPIGSASKENLPSHGQHRQGPAAPRILRIPVRLAEPIAAPTKSHREDHLPRYVGPTPAARTPWVFQARLAPPSRRPSWA